jgi:hypothetical protein
MPSAHDLLERRIGRGPIAAFLQLIGDRHAAKPEEPVRNFIFRAAAQGDEDAKLVIESGLLQHGTD